MEERKELEKFCDLPFATGYASGISRCKSCKAYITKGKLRISTREPSSFHDGLHDNWFHSGCFFQKMRSSMDSINERSIEGIEYLRWNDQEMIRDKIATFLAFLEEKSNVVKTEEFDFGSLKAEYSKSNRGRCTCCEGFFKKYELKLRLKAQVYHSSCLFETITFTGTVDTVQGFEELKQQDQDMLKKVAQPEPETGPVEEKKPVILDDSSIPELARKRVSEVEPAVVHPKKSKVEVSMADEQKMALKKQTDLWWQLRDGFEENLSSSDMLLLLKENGQVPPNDQILDVLVDCALFGKLAACPKCPNGQIVFSLSMKTYECTGYISEYTKCSYTNEIPVRSPFEVPVHLINTNPWLETLRVNLLTRRIYPESDREEVIKYVPLHGQKSRNEEYKPKQFIKNRTVVDGECEHALYSHVQKDYLGAFLMCTLGVSDVVRNVNSYFKIQLLRHDRIPDFYLFRSWGRTGTSVGGKVTTIYHSRKDAVEAYRKLFYEKTGNQWKDRQSFHKKAGMHDLIDMDYSDVEVVNKITPGSLTNLHPSIANIMKLICDTTQMEVSMKEYELDIDKMPLGKLSKRQITQALKILTELQELISDNNNCKDAVLDASNRFYTLIPHNFGMASPEPLSSVDVITKKCAMLQSLLEIVETENHLRDPVDVNYEKLHCQMEYVPPTDKEYQTIQMYLSETHGKTHSHYKLQLMDLIKINRECEDVRFRDVGNRMLLWHGSRTRNFVGILSKGLRIAPPEAPASRCMFGKGIYFADMCSKSANYAKVTTGPAFLLLCDVALGRVQDEMEAFDGGRTLIKPGFDSVKGNGQNYLDPNGFIKHPDGYAIPLGEQKTNDEAEALLYNEYIVYNVDQVRLKYLLHVNISY